jgi:AraC-like DNA-binding protein
MLKYFVCVSGREFEQRLKAARLPFGRVRRIGAHGEVRNVFEDIIREGRHASEHASQICRLLLDVLLLKIAEGVSPHARPADAARENFLRCKALADAQIERIHSLDELADAAGLDASSVCRLFRRFQGTSPYQYLLRSKMNLAAELLLGSGVLVKEAAQRVGFADPYHFSRCFKAVHGVAPRDLRRSS